MQADDQADPLVGQTLGPYRLQERLGGGGMGRVYRAVHIGLRQPRAVKVLSSAVADDPTFVARFKREARLAAGLRHPNVVPIYDVGSQDGIHYLAMALLDGRSLDQILNEDGPLALDRALAIVRQLAEAVDFAHAQGVAHRDIKPGNVVVTPTTRTGSRPGEHATLIDFGIARVAHGTALTRNGAYVGTAQYMAPEVALGQPNGPASDLYALGILTYELLTGRVPFDGGNPQTVMYAQVHRPVPPLRPDLPEAVEAAVLRQLAKRPADRYPTAHAFAAALAEAVAPRDQVRPRLAPTLPETVEVPVLRSASGRPAPRASGAAPRPPSAPGHIPGPPRPVPAVYQPRALAKANPLPRRRGGAAATWGTALLGLVALLVAASFAATFVGGSPADVLFIALGAIFGIFVVAAAIATVTRRYPRPGQRGRSG